jgi:hypothetical protein
MICPNQFIQLNIWKAAFVEGVGMWDIWVHCYLLCISCPLCFSLSKPLIKQAPWPDMRADTKLATCLLVYFTCFLAVGLAKMAG